MLIRPIRAGEPLGELQVTFARLAEQQQPVRGVALGFVRDPHVAADDGFYPCLARGRIELDQTEDVGQIGQRHGGHAIGERRGNCIVDTHHAIDDGIFAVHPQMDEAGERFPRQSPGHARVGERCRRWSRFRGARRPFRNGGIGSGIERAHKIQFYPVCNAGFSATSRRRKRVAWDERDARTPGSASS
jgi:hypothetical protein